MKISNLVDAALYFWPEAAKPVIRSLFHIKLKRALKKSLVQLVLSIIAVCMAVFTPFGGHFSLWISSILFIGTLLWTAIKLFLLMPQIYVLIKKIIQKRSISYGIVEFIKWRFSSIIKAYESARKKYKSLRPYDTIIIDFIGYLTKEAILFVSGFASYILLVYWILKPFILKNFAGLTTIQIYLFPIRQFLE